MIGHNTPFDDNLYSKIASIENLFLSWSEFRKGKRKKSDVQGFEVKSENNLFSLHEKLLTKTYRHHHYTAFYVTDPKLRHIHKASVPDRVVHHTIYRVLYPLFDKSFIDDSYSCRLKKGTHKAVLRLESFVRRVSGNYSRPCFALKCDIRKFFDSVDHEVLLGLIEKKVKDNNCMWLIREIIGSFSKKQKGGFQLDLFERERERESKNSRGIPIGNLTSQLFANVYLNELDKFVKHSLGEEFYIRYCDDFVILGNDVQYLLGLIKLIDRFLEEKLKLVLHKDKVVIRKLSHGIDFLGYVVLPYHRVLRTKTKRRMLRRFNNDNSSSYAGLLKHCNSYKLLQSLKDHRQMEF